jgi:hypothetical protein
VPGFQLGIAESFDKNFLDEIGRFRAAASVGHLNFPVAFRRRRAADIKFHKFNVILSEAKDLPLFWKILRASPSG